MKGSTKIAVLRGTLYEDVRVDARFIQGRSDVEASSRNALVVVTFSISLFNWASTVIFPINFYLETTNNWLYFCHIQIEAAEQSNICVGNPRKVTINLPFVPGKKTESLPFAFNLSSMDNSSSPSETAGKPIICKAAVCRGPGDPLVIEEIEVAPPRAWEVRIKILCTALCHSDVTFWKLNKAPLSVFPRIFGHEAVGVVESVGENVEEVKGGDTVLPVFLPNCGECRDCKRKKGNACSEIDTVMHHVMPRDGSSRFKDRNGEVIHHFLFVSSFSEYTVVDVSVVVKISPQIPVDKACLLSCGVTTGIGSAWKVAEVEEGSTVAIFGLGAVGLAVAEGARLRGVSKIIGVDVNPSKFEKGKIYGLTDFINPANCGEKRVSQVIKELTGDGVDYCFECVGMASLVEEAFESTRVGGSTIVIGVDVHGTPLKLNCFDLLMGRSVKGSFFGGVKPKLDIPLLAQKYIDKELNLDGFVTHEVSFQDINKAFDYLMQGKSIRCIIWINP